VDIADGDGLKNDGKKGNFFRFFDYVKKILEKFAWICGKK
jgi:hypothetical protein